VDGGRGIEKVGDGKLDWKSKRGGMGVFVLLGPKRIRKEYVGSRITSVKKEWMKATKASWFEERKRLVP